MLPNNVAQMVAHRLRRQPNIETTLGEHFAFASQQMVRHIISAHLHM